MSKVTLIDNHDSFTWNLVHYLGALGAEVEVVRNVHLVLRICHSVSSTMRWIIVFIRIVHLFIGDLSLQNYLILRKLINRNVD